MSGPKKIGLCLALMIVCSTGEVVADPINPCTPSEPCHLRMRDGGVVTTPKGTFTLPPGHYFDMPTWDMLDVELKRLQDQERRLEAENKSLRGSLGGWRPGWLTVASVFLLGMTAGVGGYYWYENR